MSWTPDKLAILRRMWGAGVTAGNIGREIGMTRNAVIGKASREGLAGRPSPIVRRADGSVRPKRAPSRPLGTASERKVRAKLQTAMRAPEPVKVNPARHCRWTDSSAAPWVFCDAPCQHGFSWCPEHKARVFQAGTANTMPAKGGTGFDATIRGTGERRPFNRRTDSKWSQP